MRNKIINKKSDSNKPGFTIIELVVVIAVMGILSSIAFVSYNGWKQSTTIAQLKSDLNGVAAAMENARTFNNTYPATIPSTFTASSGVTLTGGSLNGGKGYCVDAVNGTLSYNITNMYDTPSAGVCPILYLDAGNTASYPGTGTAWTDLSGSGNNGVTRNSAGVPTQYTFDGSNGGALTFDGNSYVKVNSTPALNFSSNGSFTISVWIKPNTVASAWIRGIMVQESYLSNGYRLGIANGGQPKFWTTQSGGTLDLGSSQNLTTTQWANIVVTYNNQQAYMYFNGVQTGSSTGTYIAGSNHVYIGLTVSEYYSGLLSSVSIYGRSVAPSEVQQNFNEQRVRYGI